jgi:hypothetical protein
MMDSVGNRRILMAETKGTETYPCIGSNRGAVLEFRPKDAFDQYFPKGGAKLKGPSLPFFHLEKPRKVAEN